MRLRGPLPRGAAHGTVGAGVVAASLCLAACAYSYDDGLAPLGERSSPTPAAQAAPLPRTFPDPSATVTDPPLREWTPDMVASWAEAALPDQKGLTFGFGFGMVLQGEPVLSSTALPGGTVIIEYQCRGGPTSHLTLQIAGTAVVDSNYACGQLWVRTFVAPQDAVAEVTASAANGNAAAYAFRIVKR